MEKLYKIALSFVGHIDSALALHIADCGVSPEDFFRMTDSELQTLLNIKKEIVSNCFQREKALERAKKELEFTERHSIGVHYINDADYPLYLKETTNPPVVFYQLGNTPLESPHSISIVGTRHCTSYGYNFVGKLVEYLAERYPDLLVISGLAHGIDASAHIGAVKSGVATIGVLAHGLDTLYPAQHRSLVQEMLKKGGSLITEYPSGERPFRQRFLERNRIVATMSHGVVVAESDVKGGAMSTASIAFSYSRDVMALPGKVSDKYSSGCNKLIRDHKASIITSYADVEEILGWEPDVAIPDPEIEGLFPDLDAESAKLYELLTFNGLMSMDDLTHQSGLPISKVTELITEMELDGVIVRKPGNRFSVN